MNRSPRYRGLSASEISFVAGRRSSLKLCSAVTGTWQVRFARLSSMIFQHVDVPRVAMVPYQQGLSSRAMMPDVLFGHMVIPEAVAQAGGTQSDTAVTKDIGRPFWCQKRCFKNEGEVECHDMRYMYFSNCWRTMGRQNAADRSLRTFRRHEHLLPRRLL